MIIFSRLDALFPVKVAKNVKIEQKVKWLNILTSPWAILFFYIIFLLWSYSNNNLWVYSVTQTTNFNTLLDYNLTKYLWVQWLCITVSHETLNHFDCFNIFISFIEQEKNLIRIMEYIHKYLLKTIKVIIFSLFLMVRKNFFGLPFACFGVPMQCVTQNHENMKF